MTGCPRPVQAAQRVRRPGSSASRARTRWRTGRLLAGWPRGQPRTRPRRSAPCALCAHPSLLASCRGCSSFSLSRRPALRGLGLVLGRRACKAKCGGGGGAGRGGRAHSRAGRVQVRAAARERARAWQQAAGARHPGAAVAPGQPGCREARAGAAAAPRAGAHRCAPRCMAAACLLPAQILRSTRQRAKYTNVTGYSMTAGAVCQACDAASHSLGGRALSAELECAFLSACVKMNGRMQLLAACFPWLAHAKAVAWACGR